MRFTRAVLGAACVLALGLGAPSAQADPFPGTSTTLTNGGTLTQNLFTINGSVIEVKGSSSTNTFWTLGLSSSHLVGISKIFLVNLSNTNLVSGITASSGFVQKSSSDTTGNASWSTALFDSKFPGFEDNSTGSGFGDGAHDPDPFIVVSTDSDLTAAGKTPSRHPQRYGKFTFNSSLLDGSNNLKYRIGIDYLLANGNTGRAYFSASGTTTIQSVPEPAFYQMSALLALGGLGLLRLRKRSA